MRFSATLKRLFIPLFLVGIFAVSLCFAGEPKNISSVQAQALIAKEKKLVLLDVRTPEEYRQARLRSSVLIPLAELANRLKEVPRDRPLLVYCSVGARSASAASLLSSKGYANVYQLSDGLVGWYRNGFPLER